MDQLFTVQNVTFFLCALIALAGAFGVVLSRNPVHAALSLVATLFAVAVLFLNLNAQFLGAVQVIVYTGAIVVLILFVIMLLGVDQDEDLEVEPLVAQRPIAYVLGVLLLAGLVTVIFVGMNNKTLITGEQSVTRPIVTPAGAAAQSAVTGGTIPTGAPDPSQLSDQPNINQLGELLFTRYVLAFEITAALLTIAVVGAVVLAKRPKRFQPLPEPESMDDETDAALAGEGGS